MKPLLLLCLIFPSLVLAQTIQGRVVGVTDGDTLTLLDREKKVHTIRLVGIDSPEKRQDFGQMAKRKLAQLAFDKEAVAYCHKRDRYHRQICVVKVNALDLGLEQISLGMAWWYRQYASEQMPTDRVAYEKAEIEARAYRRGLWQNTNPVPPWSWRRAY